MLPTTGSRGATSCVASTTPAQVERENFYRISVIILDLCTKGLKEVLACLVPPASCPTRINTPKNVTLSKLQRDIIKNISVAGTYNDCDVSILYLLFRNITAASFKPTKGWCQTVPASGVHPADDIERIRILRNGFFGHISSASIDNPTFKGLVGEIMGIMSRMDAGYIGFLG